MRDSPPRRGGCRLAAQAERQVVRCSGRRGKLPSPARMVRPYKILHVPDTKEAA
nr:MAG TPA: hypothetical protein [Caudoviricetes sp.]